MFLTNACGDRPSLHAIEGNSIFPFFLNFFNIIFLQSFFEVFSFLIVYLYEWIMDMDTDNIYIQSDTNDGSRLNGPPFSF